MEIATSASFSEAPGSEPRTLAALLLESIALRHQIASSAAQLVARAFAFGIDCFGFCSRVGGRNGATARSSSGPRQSCAGVTAGQRFGDIEHGLAGAAGARGF